MIKELTIEQQEQIPMVVDKWMKIQLSTQQYSDKEITDSVNKLYQAIGKSTPKIIILDSPEQCTQYIKDNKLTINHASYVCNYVSHCIWNYISYCVSYYVNYFTYNSTWNSIKKYQRNSVIYYIWNSISNSIFLDYSSNILQVKELEKYKPLLNLSEKIYFSVLYDDLTILCKKNNVTN